jgi:hypothetical protein
MELQMKNENTGKSEEDKKRNDTFIYAAGLVVLIFLGAILMILKLIGLF